MRKLFGKVTLKQIKRSDRGFYLILAVTAVLVIVAILVSALLTTRFTDKICKDHVSMAAQRVYDQLEITVNDGFELLELMAQEHTTTPPKGAILRDVEAKAMSAIQLDHKLMKFGETRYIAYGDDELYLAITDERLNGTIARLDRSKIDTILNSAYDGNYMYALFDKNTGRFLLNKTNFKSDNYYDCMLELNSSKAVRQLLSEPVTQLSFIGADGKKYYLTQNITETRGLLLVIPTGVLGFIGSGDLVALIPGLTGMLLLLLAFITYTVSLTIRRKNTNRLMSRLVNDYHTITEMVAQHAGFAVFEIERGGNGMERLLHYYIGLPTAEAQSLPVGVETLSELETALNIDSGERGKLSDLISGMKMGDTVEADIYCMLSTGVQCLRFEMYCDSSNGDRVFGCIRDCSDEDRLRRNELSEAEFVESMRPSCEYIMHVNMTRDTWKVLYSRREGKLFQLHANGTKRKYDEDLHLFMNACFDPEDYNAFSEKMTSEALKRAYYEGKNAFTADYRIALSPDGERKWYRTMVRVWQDPNNHHLKGDIFVIDVNEQKKAEMERRERADILSKSLTAMGGMYFGLFYVDLVEGAAYAAKPYRGAPNNAFVMPFKDLFGYYIANFVHPDDRQKTRDALDPWYIRKTMVQNTHLLQVRYRSLLGDVYYWSTISVQAAQFENGTVTKVVVALQRLHDIDTARFEAKETEKGLPIQ